MTLKPDIQFGEQLFSVDYVKYSHKFFSTSVTNKGKNMTPHIMK